MICNCGREWYNRFVVEFPSTLFRFGILFRIPNEEDKRWNGDGIGTAAFVWQRGRYF